MSICRIIGAGDFSPALLRPKAETDMIIAADGGLAALRAAGIEPDICVGDFDSLGALPEGVEYVRLPAEKDDTDLIAALRLGLEHGFRRFELYGVLGGRRFSHSLAAVETLFWLRDRGAEGEIIDESCRILTLENETFSFGRGRRGFISVFALSPAVVTLRGLKYPLDKYPLNCRYPLGVSNEFTQGENLIRVEGSVVVVLEDK